VEPVSRASLASALDHPSAVVPREPRLDELEAHDDAFDSGRRPWLRPETRLQRFEAFREGPETETHVCHIFLKDQGGRTIVRFHRSVKGRKNRPFKGG
jgi:hypothetical protein